MNYNCLFCDQRCLETIPDLHQWWCKACRVTFRQAPSGVVNMTFTSVNPDQSWYTLEINFIAPNTVLTWNRAPRQTNEDWQAYDELPRQLIIVNTNQAMHGVNPSNLKDKIQTLLVFS